MRTTCIFAVLSGASAFVVQPAVMSVNEGPAISRRDFASAASAALVAGAALPAFAAAGTGPKQSLFGIIGTDGASNSMGGGASSPYAEVPTWSPYSPYSNTDNGKALYKSAKDDEATKFAISVVKDSQKKFEQIPKWAEERKWEEIRAVLNQKSFDLRRSMLKLASGKSDATKAAKTYFSDIENVVVSSRRKEGASVSAAYSKSVADLNAYLSKL